MKDSYSRAKAELIRAVPVLPTKSIAESVTYYKERLGFTLTCDRGDYALLRRDYVEIHLWLCQDPAISRQCSAYVLVAGVDELFGRVVRKGREDSGVPGCAVLGHEGDVGLRHLRQSAAFRRAA